jgi:polysaccharide biosynthesis/export protein
MKSLRNNLSLFVCLSILLMSSCAPVKNIAYFQKVESAADMKRLEKSSNSQYIARIKPKDMLSITVVASEMEATRAYNLVVPQIYNTTASNMSLNSVPTLQNYLVDADGYIDFPVLGKIKAVGTTRKELEEILQEKMAPAFSKERPIITIRIVNYTVNVLGEVARPGKFETANDRFTILDALAMAGDLTIYGRRDNVMVLRENAEGVKQYIKLNLNDKNIIYSPAYYLEQNDVVYVEPNKSKSNSSNFGAAESFTISVVSTLFSLASLIITIFK